MKILMVSWEYPPVIIGGLGRHVYQLATALVADGHDVVVLCRRSTGTDAASHPSTDEVHDGVRVIAAAHDPHEFEFSTDLMAWTLATGHAMLRSGLRLHGKWTPDVVHAHDWLVAHPAIALAEFFDVPMVSTIHATEAGRHSGWVNGVISRQVHALESWLARASDSLIACSTSMAAEITELFGPGLAPITVIPNGIVSSRWPFALRRIHDGPSELLFFGRLEYEKGVHDLIAALPLIRRRHPGTILTVAGDGTLEDWLEQVADEHQVTGAVRFFGRADHDALLGLLHRADVAVLPSRYEPFGIVALEAIAAGAPLVVTDVGGLGEAVIDGQTGLSCPPGDVDALAEAVCAALDDPAAAQRRAVTARERLTDDFDWHTVAARTAGVYLASKRGERHPLARRPIIEHALPGRSD